MRHPAVRGSAAVERDRQRSATLEVVERGASDVDVRPPVAALGIEVAAAGAVLLVLRDLDRVEIETTVHVALTRETIAALRDRVGERRDLELLGLDLELRDAQEDVL